MGRLLARPRTVDPTAISVVRADGTGPVIQTGPELSGTRQLGLGARLDQDPDGPATIRPTRRVTTCSTQRAGRGTTTAVDAPSNLDWQRLAP